MTKKTLVALAVLAALAVATLAAEAQTPTTLNDSEEPGSVLVFPLFETGTVTTTDLGVQPKSSFEISVACPTSLRGPTGTCIDAGGDVDIRVEYVCPGSVSPQIVACKESNFTLNTTVGGTVVFTPSSTSCIPQPSFTNPEGCGVTSVPSCPKGYVIAWVVDESGNPIAYNGLIGDAVIRESAGAVTAYDAIPIQSINYPPRAVVPSAPGLAFDGVSYQELTNRIYGTVRYDVINGSGVDQDATQLILLTLDTLSNKPNFPTFVNLNFYDDIENAFSTSTSFVCWRETRPLNAAFSLNSAVQGPKGLVESTSSTKVPVNGIVDTAGPNTLLGLILTEEYDPTGHTLLRNYAYPLFNDSVPIPTAFVP